MKKYEVLLVGGGTGGHAAPILAVYQRLYPNKNINLTVVGNGSLEEVAFFDRLNNYHAICSGKIHRQFTPKNIVEVIKFIYGFFQSFVLLKTLKPDVVFSKGGFVSMPVVYAAKLLKIPYFFHESDIEMGKTNRFVANGAKKIFVTYPKECYPSGIRDKMVVSGPLLRESFLQKSSLNKHLFGFEDQKPIILVTGGSQGSLRVSEGIVEALPDLLKKFNIIHQAGKHSIGIAQDAYKSLGNPSGYYVCDFLKLENGKDMMMEAVMAADLVISRAGSTIVELAVLEKPMILIPWKYSAQDHQTKNADYFLEKNAALMITDDELSGQKIVHLTNSLFEANRKKLHQLAVNAKSLFPKNGAELVAQEIVKSLEKK